LRKNRELGLGARLRHEMSQKQVNGTGRAPCIKEWIKPCQARTPFH